MLMFCILMGTSIIAHAEEEGCRLDEPCALMGILVCGPYAGPCGNVIKKIVTAYEEGDMATYEEEAYILERLSKQARAQRQAVDADDDFVSIAK